MRPIRNPDNIKEICQIDEHSEFEPGGFRRRTIAMFIDNLLLIVLWLPISLPLNLAIGFIKKIPQYGSLSNIIGLYVLFYLLYEVAVFYFLGYFLNKKGGTPGKLLLGLKVVKRDTGAYLSYWQAFGRERLGKLISSLFIMVGYFWALLSKDRLTFHDLIFKTQVLHLKKK